MSTKNRTRLRKGLSIPILLVWFLFISSIVEATDTLQVHIELSEPWGFFDSTSQTHSAELKFQSGIWIEMADALSQKTGIPFARTLAPYARILRNLKNGTADFSFLPRRKVENKNVINVAFLFEVSSIVFAKKETRLQSYDDLYGKRIGIVRGTHIDTQFDQDTALFKQSYRDYKVIISMLLLDRLDYIVGNEVSIRYLLWKNPIKHSKGKQLILQKSPLWLQFSRKSSYRQRIPILKKAIIALRESGELAAIIAKYRESN